MTQLISEELRLQYLRAMGISPWISRERAERIAASRLQVRPELHEAERSAGSQSAPASLAAASAKPSYVIGPGSSQTLLVCDTPEQASSALASDIARCLDEVPVWAWRAGSDRSAATEQAGLTLESAIEDRLFTRVLLFSKPSTRASEQPDVIGSARIIRAPALPDLASNPQQKRALWSQLVQYGWSTRRA